MKPVRKGRLEQTERTLPKTIRVRRPTKLPEERPEDTLELIRGVMRRPLGTDPERDQKIMAAWGGKD